MNRLFPNFDWRRLCFVLLPIKPLPTVHCVYDCHMWLDYSVQMWHNRPELACYSRTWSHCGCWCCRAIFVLYLEINLVVDPIQVPYYVQICETNHHLPCNYRLRQENAHQIVWAHRVMRRGMLFAIFCCFHFISLTTNGEWISFWQQNSDRKPPQLLLFIPLLLPATNVRKSSWTRQTRNCENVVCDVDVWIWERRNLKLEFFDLILFPIEWIHISTFLAAPTTRHARATE